MNDKSLTPTRDLSVLKAWSGRFQRVVDQVAPASVARLSATLDRDDAPPQNGDVLPPLWHWIFFTPSSRTSELAPDGHEYRGGFLPPVDLARRMWAGGRFEFHAPLHIGDQVERVSTIVDVEGQEGRQGPLVFITVKHELSTIKGIALTEEHDIVYRDLPQPGQVPPPPQPAPANHEFSREIRASEVMLFRYSALIFIAYRMHWDRVFATQEEGYPGLVVHGPLLATLLLDLVRREAPAAQVRRFAFKAVRPIFDIHSFTVCGRREGDGILTLWAKDHEGYLAMQATAEISETQD